MVKNKKVFISESHTFTVGDNTYSVNELITKFQDMKSVTMDIDYFVKDAEHNSWFDEGEDVNMYKLIPHIERIRDADITKPIFVLETGNILDGWHRYFKHVFLFRKKIDVIPISYNDLDKLQPVK